MDQKKAPHQVRNTWERREEGEEYINTTFVIYNYLLSELQAV